MLIILVFDIFCEDLQTKLKAMKTVVNSSMIVLAREARGWNQAELAERIAMSATNLSKIERGDVGISERLLESISNTTGYPAHFFLQPGDIIPEHLGYRRRQQVSQKLLVPINARANIARRHVQFLTRALDLIQKPPQLPCIDAADPAKLASRWRRYWQVPPGPVENLVKLTEDAGIPVVLFDFGSERVDSRSIYTDDQYPLICLNKRLSGDRQRFTLAYELGILAMHEAGLVPPGKDIVHEANLFAAAFLLPEKEIRSEFRKGINIALLADLKQKWKVSMISLLYRADDLGLLSPNQRRYLLQQFNSLRIRRREPVELDIAAEKPALIPDWIGSYRRQSGLGMAEMAALLCLHADEFIELYYNE